MLKIWLSGGCGYVGSHLLHALLHGHPSVTPLLQRTTHLLYTYHQQNVTIHKETLKQAEHRGIIITSEQVDLTDEQQVLNSITTFSPDIIIHTAAYCNVSLCEQTPSLAESINVTGTLHVVNAANNILQKHRNVHMIHFSTDWCYDGSLCMGVETQGGVDTGFQVYGRSKAKAEQVVMTHLYVQHYTIVRSALIYGAPSPLTSKPSFLGFMLASLLAGKTLDLFSDEYRTPIHVHDVFQVLTRIITACASQQPSASSQQSDATNKQSSWPFSHQRIFNMGGVDRLSRLEMGYVLCSALALPSSLLVGVTLASKGLSSSRPSDLSMNSQKLYDAYHVQPRSFKQGIELVVQEMRERGLINSAT